MLKHKEVELLLKEKKIMKVSNEPKSCRVKSLKSKGSGLGSSSVTKPVPFL